MKELFLIRHAKSSWKDESLKDVDRPLNQRGERDAPMMGEILNDEIGKVDMMVSSPAVRAFTTCKIIADKLNFPQSAITLEERIYGASVERMMGLINQLNDNWNRVAIFGHNPTFTYLSERLCDINIGNLPTCGIVGIRFEIDEWGAASLGSGENILYDYPKNHK